MVLWGLYLNQVCLWAHTKTKHVCGPILKPSMLCAYIKPKQFFGLDYNQVSFEANTKQHQVLTCAHIKDKTTKESPKIPVNPLLANYFGRYENTSNMRLLR